MAWLLLKLVCNAAAAAARTMAGRDSEIHPSIHAMQAHTTSTASRKRAPNSPYYKKGTSDFTVQKLKLSFVRAASLNFTSPNSALAIYCSIARFPSFLAAIYAAAVCTCTLAGTSKASSESKANKTMHGLCCYPYVSASCRAGTRRPRRWRCATGTSCIWAASRRRAPAPTAAASRSRRRR
jgi:hypothetical protein